MCRVWFDDPLRIARIRLTESDCGIVSIPRTFLPHWGDRRGLCVLLGARAAMGLGSVWFALPPAIALPGDLVALRAWPCGSGARTCRLSGNSCHPGTRRSSRMVRLARASVGAAIAMRDAPMRPNRHRLPPCPPSRNPHHQNRINKQSNCLRCRGPSTMTIVPSRVGRLTHGNGSLCRRPKALANRPLEECIVPGYRFSDSRGIAAG